MRFAKSAHVDSWTCFIARLIGTKVLSEVLPAADPEEVHAVLDDPAQACSGASTSDMLLFGGGISFPKLGAEFLPEFDPATEAVFTMVSRRWAKGRKVPPHLTTTLVRAEPGKLADGVASLLLTGLVHGRDYRGLGV